MCGICGIVYSEPMRPVSWETLQQMTAILRHRGPDDSGLYVAPGVGLGFRRLNIVDLQTGKQPIANEDGSVVVVCNGEIYNHVELRQRLVAARHHFSTASDAEVIVHLYEDHGTDLLRQLRGMFAFALWDARRERLMLARDRLGIKPLHYAVTKAGLVFGSEQKAILASGAVPAQPDLQALRQLLSHGRIITPRTFVAGIQRLPAGQYLTWTKGRPDIRQYWHPTFPSRHDYEEQLSEQQWADGLREKLTESVQLHLRSDVPLGAWLSAGIDSSSVTALMSRLIGEPISTFTLRFEDPRFDELRAQKALDDYPQYRLVGHRIFCRRTDWARLPKAIWHAEDPQLGGVAIGQLMLGEATAPHVKAVLTGEGADEILGGYSWYATARILDPVFAFPRPLRRMLARIPVVRSNWPGAAGLIAGPRAFGIERYFRSVSHLPSQSVDRVLLSADVQEELRRQGNQEEARPLPPAFATWHPFAQMQYFDLTYRLADGVVHALDRMSMASSVEARVPFLDHELVEFCARIPPRIKMKWLCEKHILRRAMENILPPDVVKRRKRAFQLPMNEWLRGDLPPFAAEAFSEAAVREAGYFNPEQVAIFLRLHRERQANLGPALEAVLGVQLWHNLFRRAALPRKEPLGTTE